MTLAWSEYCYLLCIGIALALIVIPPDVHVPGRRIIRQLPLLAAIPIAALNIIGQKLTSSPSLHRPAWKRALCSLAPLLLLSIWIIAGSLHARVVEHWNATFLNLGTYISAALVAALTVTSSQMPTQLSKAYLRLLVCTALAMACGLALFHGRRDIYHEQIFLAIPIAVACAIAQPTRLRAWLTTGFFLALALLSMKNTSYLIALLSLLYIAVLLWLNGIAQSPSLKQLWLHYVAFLAAIIVAAGVGYLLYFRHDYLPSGNVEFREFTYRAAWQQFLDSPLWGTAFNAESVRKFTLYTVGIAHNRLPTHSDLMDLLANGGMLAMTLWGLGYIGVGVFAYRRVLAPRYLHYPWAAQAHAFAAISLAAVVTYAFNPILLQPEMAFLVWTTLGFLVGLAARCDPEQGAGEIARHFHLRAAPARPLSASRRDRHSLAGTTRDKRCGRGTPS